jgi:hypothetical protein
MTIAEGLAEMAETAARLSLGVRAEINDVEVHAVPGDSAESLREAWDLAAVRHLRFASVKGTAS